MLDYKTLTFDEIYEYLKEKKQLQWLKAASVIEDEDRRATFFEIKKAFATEFMPEILPTAKPKKATMYEIIDAI